MLAVIRLSQAMLNLKRAPAKMKVLLVIFAIILGTSMSHASEPPPSLGKPIGKFNYDLVALTAVAASLGSGDNSTSTASNYETNAELGHMYTEVGEYEVAHEYFMIAFEIASNMGPLTLQRKAAFNVAVSLISLKQYASAINILKPLLDVAEIDDVAKSSNAMIAYSQFKMHNYSAAKATAEMGYSKKLIFAKSPHSDWERMYSAIIAISEHMSGNPLEAAEWDKKADITSLNTTTNDILLGVLVKRLEQHSNPLHILSGYAAMHENAFSMFKERQSSTLAKHLISYSHKQADMQKDKALTKDAINKEIINQEAKRNIYLSVVIAGAATTSLVFSMILFSEYRYKKKIKKRTVTDFITQAPDRKTIINNAENYIKNALRESPRGVGVALINVDELKNINAAYGCKVGDAALAHIYQKIASELRSSDLFGRYSGSKFLLILTNASEQDMRCLYERLQKKLTSSPLHINNNMIINVTTSMGATRYMPSPVKNRKPPTLSSLLSIAGSHVDMATSQGREQIVII